MARRGTEVELLPVGMDIERPSKGAWLQNVLVEDNSWVVRKGFGQTAQLDTTCQDGPGYTKIVGSHILQDRQGFHHVVTLAIADVSLSEKLGGAASVDYFALRAFVLETGRYYETILPTLTSAYDNSAVPMPEWYGHLETNSDKDRSSALPGEELDVWWTPYNGTLLFGHRRIGAWCYRPIDPYADARQQLRYLHTPETHPGYSEPAHVERVVASLGAVVDQYQYLSDDAFPSPVDATVLEGQVVYAEGRDVYFAESGLPGAIRFVSDGPAEVITIDSNEDIVAIEEVSGYLLIWTPNETWHYQPSIGASRTAGRLTRISDSAGCLSPNAATRTAAGIVWADARGVYLCAGGLEMQKLSEPIADVFDRTASNPLTSYYNNTGFYDLSDETARSFVRVRPGERVKATFWARESLWMLSMPEQRYALVFDLERQSWFVWVFESMAATTASSSAVTANLPEPFVVAEGDTLTLVSGPEYADAAFEVGGSVIICEYGRGGALDRSVGDEDQRRLRGYFDVFGSGSDGNFWLGEPVPAIKGTALPQGTTPDANYWLVPLYLEPLTIPTLNLQQIDLVLTFNNTDWEPVVVSGTARLDVGFPPERHFSRYGWGYVTPVSGTAEAQVYQAGSPNAAGNELHLRWNGPTGWTTKTWSFTNQMQMIQYAKNPLLFIPMKRRNSGTASEMWAGASTATFEDLTNPNQTAKVYAWQMGDGGLHADDDTAQAVDWALKSERFGMGEGMQAKLRGLFMRMVSSGSATNVVAGSAPFGLFNAIAGANFADWAAQFIDFTSGQVADVPNHETVRTRVLDASAGMVKPVLNSYITWGDAASSTPGNFVLGDPAFDEISLSDSVRGENFTWMVFGHVRNKAESLLTESMTAVLRPRGNRRRWGRG